MLSSYRRYDKGDIPEDIKYFKEESICEVLTIPCEKPDMERILDIAVWPEIENIRLVDTEVGYSVEGQRLSGMKLIVEVRLKEKVTYVADEITQSVHASHYEILKSIFIVVPSVIQDKPICNLIKSGRLTVEPYIEDVMWEMLDCRKIHKCVMLFLNVSIC